jgi:hypothetical protein
MVGLLKLSSVDSQDQVKGIAAPWANVPSTLMTRRFKSPTLRMGTLMVLPTPGMEPDAIGCHMSSSGLGEAGVT